MGMSKNISHRVTRKGPASLFDQDVEVDMGIEWTVERWIAEATFFVGSCPKCNHGTIGKYVPIDRFGDCGIVEGCQMCSWEVVRIRGRHRVPVEWRL